MKISIIITTDPLRNEMNAIDILIKLLDYMFKGRYKFRILEGNKNGRKNKIKD